MKRLKFLWIDDKQDRVDDYRMAIEQGGSSFGASAKITSISADKEIITRLVGLTEGQGEKRPDLIIIDHVFNGTIPLGINGSSVAHLLRQRFSQTPMVCVSAMLEKEHKFNQEDLAEYMVVFPYHRLDEHIGDLYAIAQDFRKLSPGVRDKGMHLVRSLRAPRRDRDDLLRILPQEFRDPTYATTEHRMGRWVFNELLERPGFLYDRLHAATMLGLSEAGFRKVEGYFGEARYSGVLASPHRERWWVSELRRLLFLEVGENGPDQTQFAGRALPGIRKSDHSVCYVSKKSVPPPTSVVLADTTTGAKRLVVHPDFAGDDPRDPGTTPGFEASLILARQRGS